MRNEGILNDFAREINTFVYFYDKFYWIGACGNPPGDFGFGGSLHPDGEYFLFHFAKCKAMLPIEVRAVPLSGSFSGPSRFLVPVFGFRERETCHPPGNATRRIMSQCHSLRKRKILPCANGVPNGNGAVPFSSSLLPTSELHLAIAEYSPRDAVE